MSPVPAKEFDALFTESEKRARAVHSLPKGATVHISGICGTGMASVLQLLKELGYRVTGSDKAFYPPMGDVVRRYADTVFEGYDAKNLDPRPDLVVIGNSLVRDNPEAVFVRENGLPYASMPEVFSALLVGDRAFCPLSIVVCGTHGKSTTTAATATLLETGGRKPGFFIGGIPNNFSTSIRAVSSDVAAAERVAVLEGDEYDSAYFAKWSKFLSYRADIAVLTSLEFDHADIYDSLDQIEEEFRRLFSRIPKTGTILICDEGRELREATARFSAAGYAAPIALYGRSPDSHFRLLERAPEAGGQRLRLSLRGREIEAVSPLGGPHNALNILAAAAAADLSGVPASDIRRGIEEFRGVLRRQQLIADVSGVLVIEDFAHHPTAVEVTLQGIREQYPGRRIVAVFEPRSNSSRRALFQEQYAGSFGPADLAVILEVSAPAAFSGTAVPAGQLDVRRLVEEIGRRGTKGFSAPEISLIEDYLASETRSGDVLVLMSNGDFGGLMRSLPARLARRDPGGRAAT